MFSSVMLSLLILQPDGLTLKGDPGTVTSLDSISWQTGKPFTTQLQSKLFATWSDAPLSTVFDRIARQQKIAIHLDRRVDPGQLVTLSVNNETTLQAIETVASTAGLKVTILGATVVISDPSRIGTLRTLAALREQQFRPRLLRTDRTTRLKLTARPVLTWNDLESSNDVLVKAAARFGVQFPTQSPVPHDLWRSGVIAGCSVSETLTLLLWEFDLHFTWEPSLRAIKVTPLPEQITITRSYRPRGLTASAAAVKWKTDVSGIGTRASGSVVIVDGTVEQHELVDRLSKGLPAEGSSTSDPKPEAGSPLAKRRFTLRLPKVPAIALLTKLNQSGMTIKYDSAALTRAGIDLQTPISFDVKNATADEFFTAITTPLGLNFSIEGTTVTFTPK